MVADVADYEAFYRLWLPIELARNLGGVEEARYRAHGRAIEECEYMVLRQGSAEVMVFSEGVAIPVPVNGKKKRGA